MGWLKTIGQIVAQVGAIVLGFGPVFKAANPQSAGIIDAVASDLAEVGKIIVLVESFANGAGGLSGAQKLSAAVPAVEKIVLSSALMAGKTIDKGKADLWTAGIQQIVSGIVSCLNATKADSIEIQSRVA